MSKKIKYFPLILILLTTCLSSGCFTVERSTVRSTGQEHILVSNYGWYLFDSIPLACGNANLEPLAPWVLFRDDVTMDKVQQRFMRCVRIQRAEADNLTYTTQKSVMLEIPGLNFPVPIPYLLTYKEIQLSGTLFRKRTTRQ